MPPAEYTGRYPYDKAPDPDALAGKSLISPEAGRVFRQTGISLLLDATSSMKLWKGTIRGFRTELQSHGILVKPYLISTDNPTLLALSDLDGQSRHAEDLVTAESPDVVLMLSPCITPAWKTGKIPRFLQTVGESKVVGIGSMLGERQWRRTALGYGRRGRIQTANDSDTPLLNNRDLQRGEIWQMEEPLAESLPLPLLSLDERYLTRFAEIISGKPAAYMPAVYLNSEAMPQQYDEERREDEFRSDIPPEERMRQFYSSVSPLTRTLAGLVATAPLDNEITQSIRAAMLPEATEGHFAEIVLSGLVKTSGVIDDISSYDFLPGIREELLAGRSRSESHRALIIAADVLSRRHPDEQTFAQIAHNPHLEPGNIDVLQINPTTYGFLKACALTWGALSGYFYGPYSTQLSQRLEEYEQRTRS